MTGVLICDDHRIVRQGIKQVLADAPEICVVAEASDGQEALRLVTEKRVELHVVLLDIALPGLDGLRCCSRSNDPNPACPCSCCPRIPSVNMRCAASSLARQGI